MRIIGNTAPPVAQRLGLTLLRVVVGVIFAAHGLQKFTQQGGIAGVGGFFGQLGVPAPELMAWVVAIVELVGGVMLIAGLLTRPVAVALAIDMLAATVLVHWENGLFAQAGGYELTLLLLAASLALAIAGPGEPAADRYVFGRST